MANLVTNKKARFDYEVGETFEAGLKLSGNEVKSLRLGQGSLDGSHVIVRGGEVFLVGATIPPYQPNNTPDDYIADKPRKLLLTKKEIDILTGLENQKGLTIVPLAVYNKGRKLKISIASVKGKKKYDKRETIKRREADIEIGRTLKRR